MGRKLKSRLDLLKPRLDQRVQHKQECQKEGHDKRAKVRSFKVGDSVYVKNHGRGDKWLFGTIVESYGPLSYQVELPDQRVVRCHQDHIRPKTGPRERSATSDDLEDVLLDIPPTNSPAVTVPEQKDTANSNPATDSEPLGTRTTLPHSSTTLSGLLWPYVV